MPSGQGISELQAGHKGQHSGLGLSCEDMSRSGRGTRGCDHQAERRLTLPEGQKDDGLDHEELEDRAVGTQQIPGGEVEEEEGVKGQAD